MPHLQIDATISPINKKDNKCFQYAVTVTLNQKEIKKKKYTKTITKVRPFINNYKWKEEGSQMKKDSIML